MKSCRACFGVSSPVALITAAPAVGNCDFCGSRRTEVWSTAVWADAFARVLDIYEPSDSATECICLQFQRDWRVFSFDDHERVHQFLSSAFAGGYQLVEDDTPVEPRYSEADGVVDFEGLWESFVRELQTINRFFPPTKIDLEALENVVRSHIVTLDTSLELYRARVRENPEPFTQDEMGKPPAALAPAGRANPPGIAHLYVSLEEETAVKESRAFQNNYVSIARFRLQAPLAVLNLAETTPENPFLVEEGLVARLAYGRYLSHLGSELSRPTRRSDNPLEYIPTQYLCDFVKSLGIVGVSYASALNPGGNNLVLFEDVSVRIDDVYVVDVQSTAVSYSRV